MAHLVLLKLHLYFMDFCNFLGSLSISVAWSVVRGYIGVL